MTKVSDIFQIIDAAAPFSSCESFDNVGVLIGDPEREVGRCLVTLDVTQDTVQEAVEKNCELIISHHPIIFHPLRQIPFHSVQGQLLQKEITVLSAHTNFDKAPEGLNRTLGRLLGMELTPLPSDSCAGIAEISPTDFETLLEKVAHTLLLQGVRYYDAGKTVKKVMICCGGGGSCIHEAIDMGADCLISGDFKHDQVIDAMNAGVSCIDAGHYETERHFVPLCCNWLSEEVPSVCFLPSETMRPGFTFRTFEWKE